MVTDYPLRITLELSKSEADKIKREIDKLATPDLVPQGFGGFGAAAAGPHGGGPLTSQVSPADVFFASMLTPGGGAPETRKEDDVGFRGALASGGLAGALGLGGGESLTGALSSGFTSLLGPLLGIFGAVAVISAIVGNEFSALKDLVEIAGTIVQLYLKPISDLLFTLFKPFLIAFIKVLPFWLQFVQDPAKGFGPLIEAIGVGLITAVGEIFGVSTEDIEMLVLLIKNDLAPAFTDLWNAIKPLVPPLTKLSVLVVPGLVAGIFTLTLEIEKFAAKITLITGAVEFVKNALIGLAFELATLGSKIFDMDFGDLIPPSPIDFSDFISPLNWGEFISNIAWGIWIPFINWMSWIPTLDWSDFVSSIGGGIGDIIPGLDFIKTPQGQILRTSPEDFLIGSKNPAKLFAGAGEGSGRPTTVIIAPVFNGLTFREAQRRFENELDNKLRRFFS